MKNFHKLITAVYLGILAVPCAADNLSSGYDIVGTYTLNVDGEPLLLSSVSNAEIEYSDLYFQGRSNNKSYTIQASADVLADTTSVPPILLVDLVTDQKTNEFVIRSVVFVDQDWKTPLSANPSEFHGQIKTESLQFHQKSGSIFFDFDAEMIRLDWQSHQPIPNARTVQIHGRFTGKFPEFALMYPYISGDY